MANTVAHQPQDFGIGIIHDTDVGTPVDNTTQLFTDSVSLPSFTPDQDLSVKSGKFVADFEQIYSTSKNTPIEISFTGLLNDTAMTLLEGILHKAAGSGQIDVNDTYTAPNLYHGLTTAAATRTYTVKLLSPTLTDNSSTSPGCVELTGCTVTAFSVFADANSDSGRVKYSATIKTGYSPTFLHAAGTIGAVATTGLRNIHDFTSRTIAGVSDPVMQSFNLSIENSTDYIGWDPTNNRPYAISRSVPEGPSITLSSTVKLDLSTKDLLGNFMNASAQTGLTNHVANNGTFGSATEFGFTCDKAIITGMSLNEQAAMMYDVEQKLLFGTFSVRNT
tara:strand:+ start:685 stop:1686 length:1002 start_codon:yes stop_codon:yes gene_type:complete